MKHGPPGHISVNYASSICLKKHLCLRHLDIVFSKTIATWGNHISLILWIYYLHCLRVFPQSPVHLIIYFYLLGINWKIISEMTSLHICWHNMLEGIGESTRELPQFTLPEQSSLKQKLLAPCPD